MEQAQAGEPKSLQERIEDAHGRLSYQRKKIKSLEEEIAAVRDGLDAWAGRIQRLEALPGVAEALAAVEKEEDK